MAALYARFNTPLALTCPRFGLGLSGHASDEQCNLLRQTIYLLLKSYYFWDDCIVDTVPVHVNMCKKFWHTPVSTMRARGVEPL